MELSAAKAVEILSHDAPVLLLNRPGGLEVFPLRDAPSVIGRDSACDIVLEHDHLAPRHVMIQQGPQGLECLNLASRGETLKNGQAVEAAALSQGDELRVGRALFTFVNPQADVLPPGCQLLALPLTLLRQQAMVESQLARTRQQESFGDIFLDSLKRSPWILLSGAVHALIYVVLLSLIRTPDEKPQPPRLEVEMTRADVLEDARLDDEEVEEVEPDEEELEEPPDIDEEFAAELEASESKEDSADLDAEADYLESRGALRMSPGTDRGIGGTGFDIGLSDGSDTQFKRRVQDLKQSGLDVVILLDATLSMDAEIGAAKKQLAHLLASLQGTGIHFRLGVVAFRDHGEEYVTRTSPLTDRIYKSVAFLDSLSAQGGGDEPEALLEAFRSAGRLRFSPRAEKILILVGDAPPKPNTTRSVLQLVSRFAERGGHVHTIYSDTTRSGRDPSGTAKVFQSIARAGSGQAVNLSQKSRLVADIVRLTLHTKSNDRALKLLKGLEEGPRAERIRRRLRRRDLAFVEKALLLPHLDPQIPLELLHFNHMTFLPAYFAVLNERDLPIKNRWLATVLLRRLLAGIDSYRGMREVRRFLSRFDPESPFPVQRQQLTRLKKFLFAAGLLEFASTKLGR